MIQLQFLNMLLESRDVSMITVNNLTDEFFCDYRNEFNYIKNHYTTYGTIPDKYTFIDVFPDFDFITVTESKNYLLDKLYEDKNQRFLANTFNKVRNLLNEGKTDEAMAVYTNAADLAVKAKHLDSVDILKDTSRYDAYLDRCTDFNKYYIKTGFPELDKLIGGWDRQEELVTIAARTNVGKSWIAIKCATSAVEQGLRVGFYSGEMSERKVGYRFDTMVGHISNSGLIHGNGDIQNEYRRYIDTLSTKYTGCFKVLTPAMIQGPAGVSALRAFIEKENLDILFVDQHSLLEDDHRAKNPVERAANISKDLKNLQVLKRIPIITVSQQNRASTENGVNTEHIAQSDRIAQDSTIIIFFEKKDDKMTLHMVKSRDSANMKNLQYAVDFDKGIFTYIPEEDNALDGEGCDELRAEYEMSDNGTDEF